MKRTPSYSRAAPAGGPAGVPASRTAVGSGSNQAPAPAAADVGAASQASQPATRSRRWAAALASPRALWLAWLALAIAAAFAFGWQQRHRPIALTQEDIDRAVLQTLSTQPIPAMSRRAADKILPSVVRVVGLLEDDRPAGKASPGNGNGDGGKPRVDGKGNKGGKAPSDAEDDDERPRRGVGTGVVIVDSGLILTNFHVIHGAKTIRVTFWNGFESEARVVNVQPDKDLAVIKALSLPDDLQPATLRGTGDLAPGDAVVAVGYPFGIGPSVSAGVVSGLDREFRSPEGKQTLSHLIQFDAAANPGNSGGPLVNSEGEVLGIVTAILNPTEARTFIGIGFAVTIESAGGMLGFPPF
jgi:serine protease DegQ